MPAWPRGTRSKRPEQSQAGCAFDDVDTRERPPAARPLDAAGSRGHDVADPVGIWAVRQRHDQSPSSLLKNRACAVALQVRVGGACGPPPPVAAPLASSLRAPSRGDPPHDGASPGLYVPESEPL